MLKEPGIFSLLYFCHTVRLAHRTPFVLPGLWKMCWNSLRRKKIFFLLPSFLFGKHSATGLVLQSVCLTRSEGKVRLGPPMRGNRAESQLHGVTKEIERSQEAGLICYLGENGMLFSLNMPG